jgi:hypothetical protein
MAKTTRGASVPPTKDETRKAIVQRELQKLSDKNAGRLTPELVLAAAAVPTSPLHEEFEWRDDKAAIAYRLDQARRLIRYVTLVVIHRSEKVVAPYYVRDPQAGPKEQGYVSLGSTGLARQDAEDIITSEFDRCRSAIERARGVASKLDSRFPGLQDDLEELLDHVLRLRRRFEREDEQEEASRPNA